LTTKNLFFYNFTPSGLKIQLLPIFYNNTTPWGLKYLALNPEGGIHFLVFFEQMAKWQIRTLFLLRYLFYCIVYDKVQFIKLTNLKKVQAQM